MKNIAKIEALRISKTKEMFFSAAFTALAVYAPALIHYFSGVDGGRTLLPMPFFVLLAGLILGWQAGLITAVASPIISYLISGMPVAALLPFITMQLIVFGAVVGLMRGKFNAFFSVAGAIAAGWVTIGIALFLFSRMSAIGYVTQGLKIGYLGIVIQIITLPAIVFFAKRYFENEKQI